MPNDADDELWNLLDVIHRKSMRLRDEVDRLQQQQSPSKQQQTGDANAGTPATLFREHLDRMTRDDVRLLRRERDKLLEKLFQMEGVALADRLKSVRLQDDMEALQLVKLDLEAQLHVALSQKVELNSRIQDMQQETAMTTTMDVSELKYQQQQQHLHQSQHHLHQHHHQHHQKRPAIDPGDMFASAAQPATSVHSTTTTASTTATTTATLGRLDGVVSTPSRSTRVRVTDSKKFEAILLETNIVELQRHLLTITVQNQVRARIYV